jgi:predicted nucleic acid-binding Zn ribbon protein
MDTKTDDKKICPLCTEGINKAAIICPKCGNVIGGWKQQVNLFMKFRMLIVILGTLATLVAGFFINRWISSSHQKSQSHPPVLQQATPPVVQEEKARLIYSYNIEKGPVIKGSGKKTYTYYIILSVVNQGKVKLNKVRINLDLSKDIISHRLPYQYDILNDKGVKIDDLSKYFAGRKKAVIIVPFCLPEQTISMSFATKGEAKIDDIEIYSDETKGTKAETTK